MFTSGYAYYQFVESCEGKLQLDRLCCILFGILIVSSFMCALQQTNLTYLFLGICKGHKMNRRLSDQGNIRKSMQKRVVPSTHRKICSNCIIWTRLCGALGSPPNLFKLATTCYFYKFLGIRCEVESTPSRNKTQQIKDHVAATKNILPAVKACGFFSWNEVVQLDHRIGFVTWNTK